MNRLRLRLRLWRRITDWLTREENPRGISPCDRATSLCDFERLRGDLRPGDVLLVEGRSRMSEVIKLVTQSPWTHAALYVGRLHDIRNRTLRNLIVQYYDSDFSEQLIIEALLGQGTRITPLSKYKNTNVRMCRPSGLSPADAQRVIAFAASRLGTDYDVRQLLDLARFFFPWTFLPRRWRSSLFEHNAGGPTRTVCSCLLAEAFGAVDFPVLPFIARRENGALCYFRRNPRLFTPRDFDYSPYFQTTKYPILGLDAVGLYHQLPWSPERQLYSDRDRRYNADLTCATPMQGLTGIVPALDGAVSAQGVDENEEEESCPAC